MTVTEIPHETLGSTPRSDALLDRYHEAFGGNPTYTVLRTIVTHTRTATVRESSQVMDCGHETYYLRYEGEVAVDITGRGREGERFEGRSLKCECEFKEGMGWQKREDGTLVTLSTAEKCQHKNAAQHVRFFEVRALLSDVEGYSDHFPSIESEDDWQHGSDGEREWVKFALTQLLTLSEQSVWLGEDPSGSNFWGGQFYVQEAAQILGVDMINMWPAARELVEEQKITLEGAVVCTYRPPREPVWDEPMVTDDGMWLAALPAHSDTPHVWKVTHVLSGQMFHLPLDYPVDFGPDAADLANLERFCNAVDAGDDYSEFGATPTDQ